MVSGFRPFLIPCAQGDPVAALMFGSGQRSIACDARDIGSQSLPNSCPAAAFLLPRCGHAMVVLLPQTTGEGDG